jgi:superfamily I DNA/RNA helicase
MFTLSPQQSAAVEFAANGIGSGIIEAGAGCAKTFTLVKIVETIPTDKSVCFCAFNKPIAMEIGEKIAPFNLENVKVGTLHSFGFGALRRSISRIKVDANKLKELARREFNGEYENLREFVISATRMAKEFGIGATCANDVDNWNKMIAHHNLWDSLPDGVNEEQGINAARHLLECSNSLKQIIDFSDMIYVPVLNKNKIWQYDYILLDEAQDTNSTRRALVKMMLKPNGRLIAVGDSAQAIYGFTGADSEALNLIASDFNAIRLPLTVTYRCPKNVVKLAHNWVDGSKLQAAESAPDGIVDSCELRDVAKLATAQDAVICRNTKPLVELAYNLIRNSVACRVEGRSIGEGLVKLAQRWKTVTTVGELETRLEQWAESEMVKNKAKGNDSRCQVVEDQHQTLQVFIMQCEDSDPISTLVAAIRSLFGDTESGQQKVLTLSTIHKAKGREWDRVFALGMSTYSPSKWAKQAWELVQEDNLCYVQVTRAKQHLTLVNVPAKKS